MITYLALPNQCAMEKDLYTTGLGHDSFLSQATLRQEGLLSKVKAMRLHPVQMEPEVASPCQDGSGRPTIALQDRLDPPRMSPRSTELSPCSREEQPAMDRRTPSDEPPVPKGKFSRTLYLNFNYLVSVTAGGPVIPPGHM